MKTKQRIYSEVEAVLKKITNQDIEMDASTALLGSNNLIDSLTILDLLAWSNDFYRINVIEDDIHLECLKTIGFFVDQIYELCNTEAEADRI